MMYVTQLSALLALGLLLSGCVLLHLRLRRPSSLSVLLCLLAITVWSFGGQSVLYDALLPAGSGSDARMLTKIGLAQDVTGAVESALMLWLGLSFLLAVRNIRNPAAP